VGVTRGGESAIVQRELNLPVRAMVWADDGIEIPRNESLCCFEAMNRPVRLLSDGPAVLIEGREIVGPLRSDRATRIRRVLGTGKELIVADRSFNTFDHFQAAPSVMDTGFARSLERNREEFHLCLFRALLPGDRHRLFLWSPLHGMTFLEASAISAADGGRAWTFRASWETDTLLAAVAYEGQCIAAAWCGQDERFYDPHATDGLDPVGRIALIRWCRLPGLRPDPDARQSPLIGRLASFPLEMVRIALLDEGLPEGLGLVFDDRQSPRGELFNVIFREVYLRPTQGDMSAVFNGLPNDFNRLMVYHPLLGCRALQTVVPQLVEKSGPQTRMLLSAMRLQFLSLGGVASSQDIVRREGELLARACYSFSENGEPMAENAVREGLIDPVMQEFFGGRDANLRRHEANLRTALGVAPFREYLAAMILRRFIEQLA
jgi:hypothetical protein